LYKSMSSGADRSSNIASNGFEYHWLNSIIWAGGMGTNMIHVLNVAQKQYKLDRLNALF
jgi:hypothetical protein